MDSNQNTLILILPSTSQNFCQPTFTSSDSRLSSSYCSYGNFSDTTFVFFPVWYLCEAPLLVQNTDVVKVSIGFYIQRHLVEAVYSSCYHFPESTRKNAEEMSDWRVFINSKSSFLENKLLLVPTIENII